MKTIEIITPQNVPLQYELAPLRDRIFAMVIDLILFAVLMLILTFTFKLNTTGEVFAVYFSLYAAYFLLSEILMNGQTLGKKALKIRVIKINGFEIGMNDYLIRWLLSFLDVLFTGGTFAVFMVNSTENSQRLGDIIANTTVVKLKPERSLKLSDLMKLSVPEDYVPTYPDVVRFNEEDMLLLKATLTRYQKYKNEAHLNAVKLLAQHLADQMQLNSTVKNHIEFLNKVLKDYITLTR